MTRGKQPIAGREQDRLDLINHKSFHSNVKHRSNLITALLGKQRTLWTIALVSAALGMSRDSAAGALSYLRTQGQDIVDESGKKIMLRGVGLGNWLLPEGYMWGFGEQGDRPRKIEKIISDLVGPVRARQFWTEFRQNYITEADIARIAELGFNSVRPALNARLFLTEGDEARDVEEGYRLLDNLVSWCRKHGVYVIIDMHAAPGGQTGANIDDSAKDQPELFMDRRNQDRLVDLWVKIARRYKDEPAVAAYDLLNEPLPRRTGAEGKYKDQLEPLYRRITAAIRQVDPKHMITVEGADWANDWSVFTEPFDKNLLYQFHFYCWERPTKLNSIERFIEQRNRLNAPVWVGETGEKDNAIYWATTDYFEANNIGWSFWPWKKMDTRNTPYSIKPPEGWEQIRAYSRGRAKPSAEVAQEALDELVKNIRLENCVFFPDVVNAIFRRVPGRVEAENYGHQGPNKSYGVRSGTPKAAFYRTSEPVPIEQIQGSNRRNSGQAIHLRAQEWTAYEVTSLQPMEYGLSCRAKAPAGDAILELTVDGQTREVNVDTRDWSEVTSKRVHLSAGTNVVRLEVKTGEASVDWLSFTP